MNRLIAWLKKKWAFNHYGWCRFGKHDYRLTRADFNWFTNIPYEEYECSKCGWSERREVSWSQMSNERLVNDFLRRHRRPV